LARLNYKNSDTEENPSSDYIAGERRTPASWGAFLAFFLIV
jgi:hypothetical protein